MKRSYIKPALLAVLGLIVAVVAFQNRQEVEVRLLLITVSMPRALLILISAALGFAGGVITDMLLRPASRAKSQAG